MGQRRVCTDRDSKLRRGEGDKVKMRDTSVDRRKWMPRIKEMVGGGT